jgi:anaerobic selenocysteine-containing dehydrogenase
MLLSNSGHQRFNTAALQRPDLLGSRRPRVLNMSTIGDHLAPDAPHAPVRALVVYNSNPVAVAPDSARVVAGFAREDLFTVVLEHFRTDTADYADYLLPATTQLEHWDVHGTYGHTDVVLNKPAITPRGQARTNTDIFRSLARYMGFEEACFADDDESLCQQALRQPDGHEFVPFATLTEQGFASIPGPEAPFAHGQFPTPSGRCEFMSERLQALGLDGLPDYLPNYEAPTVDSLYPLAMISPPARHFLNSTFVNVTSLRDVEGEPLVEIHPQDAQARGVHNGQTVTVSCPRDRPHPPGRGGGSGHLVAPSWIERHQCERTHQPGPDGPGSCPDLLRLCRASNGHIARVTGPTLWVRVASQGHSTDPHETHHHGEKGAPTHRRADP